MRGLLHMPVTVMLLLSALLLKLLVLPDHWPWWGFFFSSLFFFHTPPLFVGLKKPGGAGSSPQMCSLQCLKAVHQVSGEGART